MHPVNGPSPNACSNAQTLDQIATVNKLKQKLRNAVATDTSLAVPFLRLAINDAVSYDISVRLIPQPQPMIRQPQPHPNP